MSGDLGVIIKDGADDMVQAGEKAGTAIASHFSGIGEELESAAGRYRGVESDLEQSFTGVADDGATSAEQAADSAGRDLILKRPDEPDPEDLPEAARPHGQGGATEDPIDVVTGEMFLAQCDLVLPGTLPLEIGRRHGSAYRRGRWFGDTWSSTLDQRIEFDEQGVRFISADGRALCYEFARAETGEPVLPSYGARWPLIWNREDDVIAVRQSELGVTLLFPPGRTPRQARPLSAIVDRAGNRITFVYDAEGVPAEVYHSGGYHLVLDSTYTRGGVRISAMRLTDPAGGADLPVRRYRYDIAGRMVAVADAEGRPLHFEYDAADRITAWTDRNGYSYRYTYRPQDGRVVRAEGTDGFLDVALDYDLAARSTTLTDALGHTTVFHWNAALQTVRFVDALGNETRTERDAFGQVLAHTDQLGHTTRYQRDDEGRPTRVARPDGSVVSVDYDADGRPLAMVGGGGAIWQYSYDERGSLVAATDPTGARTGYEVDDQGRLTAQVDALGARTVVACDRAGLPVRIADPAGGVESLRRDAFGRIVSIADQLGAVTELRWTADGRLGERRHPDGSMETWEYDAEGHLLVHRGPTGAETRYEYGPFDRAVARTDPGGERYAFEYDRRRRLVAVTNPLGERWSYEYDGAGNLVRETDFSGAVQAYEYDAAGQLARRVNPAGQVTRFARDRLGQVVERRGDSTYRYEYDGEGNLVRAEGPGSVIEYSRDALGRVCGEALNGRVLRNEFDPLGQRIRRLTPSLAESRWSFDQAGRAVGLQAPEGWLSFEYDQAGRETRMSLGAAASTTQSMPQASMPEVPAAQASVTQAFDLLGRLTGQAIWSAEGGSQWQTVQARAYGYRADGLPVEISDVLRGTRRFEFDQAGRPTAVTAEGRQEAYAYDPAGNLAEGAAGSEPAPRSGRLLRARGEAFEYDEAGRVVRRTRRTLSGQTREWTYTWDADDRLVAVRVPDGTVWQYTYDAIGRRVGKRGVRPDGTECLSVAFTWDGARLAEEASTAPDGRVDVLTWDYRPGTFTPVAQTRRSRAATAPQDVIDREFHAIVADLVGTPMELVSPAGRVEWFSTRTVWGEAAVAPGAAVRCPLRFPGQYHDDETGLDYNLYRYYDPSAGEYLSPDPIGLLGGPRAYGYPGNPLTRTDPLGLCPSEDGRGAPGFIVDSNGVANVRGPGRPDNDLVLSGHGGIAAGDNQMVTIPKGTTLSMYSPHGVSISDSLGNRIETGNPTAMFTFKEGDQVPDYYLFPPGAPLQKLNIKGSPLTVTGPTRLSDLLRPNMGETHWAACRSVMSDAGMKSLLAKF